MLIHLSSWSDETAIGDALMIGLRAAPQVRFTDQLSVFAVDWSGAVYPNRKLWLAEVRQGQLTRLDDGWTRETLVAHLLQRAAHDPKFVVGIDFAFSMPSSFLALHNIGDVTELWTLAKDQGERWLAECQPPFWGRAGLRRPIGEPAWHFRQTELAVPPIGGIRPKSVFQVGGPGTVGTGSIRGMPHLLTLQAAGFWIWPFGVPGWPRIVEIYPRLFTDRLRKTSKSARLDYLSKLDWEERFREKAAASDDALDAAVSALFMSVHLEALSRLHPITDGPEALEGAIWHPNHG